MKQEKIKFAVDTIEQDTTSLLDLTELEFMEQKK